MANHSSGPDRTIGQSHCMHAIAPVRTPDAVVAAIKLFRAYAASLNVDLSYQDFEAEMEAMPGKDSHGSVEHLLFTHASGESLPHPC